MCCKMVSREYFKFQPTDEELVSLLEKKMLDPAFDHPIIKELNIYKCHPRELIGLSSMSDEQVSYVFCTLDPKYDKGKLQNRKAKGGSWKITCGDWKIMAKNSNKQIGVRRTLSFYEGSATKKENWTDYKMYEYHEYPRKDNSFFQLESQLLPKQHVSPIIGDHVAKATMSQLESQLLQLPNFHWFSTTEDHLRNNSFSEMEEPQLLPNQHVSSNFEDYVAKSTFFEIESQLLANHQLSSDIENNAAKSFP